MWKYPTHPTPLPKENNPVQLPHPLKLKLYVCYLSLYFLHLCPLRFSTTLKICNHESLFSCYPKFPCLSLQIFTLFWRQSEALHANHLLTEGLLENCDIANKVLLFCFFFKSLTVLISTDSDSALALVNRKVKTWPERRVGALHFRYSKRTVRDFFFFF